MNWNSLAKMLPKTSQARSRETNVDVFNLTQGTEQMRRENNQICYLGECDHRLRMPNSNRMSPVEESSSQTFYSA